MKEKTWSQKLFYVEGIGHILHDPEEKPERILHRMKIAIPLAVLVSIIVMIFDVKLGVSILAGTSAGWIIAIFGYYEIKIRDKLAVNKIISVAFIVIGAGGLLLRQIEFIYSPGYIYWTMLVLGLVSFWLMVLVKKHI